MQLHDDLESVFRMVFNDDDLIIQDETTADDVDGWDSVKHVTLIFSIEEAFGVEFTEEALSSFRNVGDMKRYLANSIGSSTTSAPHYA